MLSNFLRSTSLGKGVTEKYLRYKKQVFNTPKKTSAENMLKNQKVNVERKASGMVDEMLKLMDQKAPRIGTVLAIGSTVPCFYYLYKLVWEEYNSKEFYQSIKGCVDWINYVNIFTAAVYFGLEAVRYSDRRAKHHWKSPRQTYVFALIPLVLSFGSLSFTDSIHKYMILPTLASDVSMLLVESVLTNQNLIPYWVFDFKYRIHFFTIMQLCCLHYGLKYLGQDVAEHPEKYKGEGINVLPPDVFN